MEALLVLDDEDEHGHYEERRILFAHEACRDERDREVLRARLRLRGRFRQDQTGVTKAQAVDLEADAVL